MVSVRELIAWDLDEYSYRDSALRAEAKQLADKIVEAKQSVAEREEYKPCRAFLDAETEDIREMLSVQTQRPEFRNEYAGLDWELGVVDLRALIAFQRRLILDVDAPACDELLPNDWPRLVSLAFELQRSTGYSITLNERKEGYLSIDLHSSNPDFELRLLPNKEHSNGLPFSLFGGSPFLEVAVLGGRWFLRDGYHRAYNLLRMGVYFVPTVIIHARSINELGAIQPWFFNEEQLFSAKPPLVTDFLQQNLVLDYLRPRFIKTIRICIEESLQPVAEITGKRGDHL
jgi:hypothetical protein